MANDLLSRAAELKAHNQKLEQTRGSGYHDLDTDPTNRGRLLAPQHQTDPDRGGQFLPRVSEHLIAFHGEHEVVFAGEDAQKAHAALLAWYEKNKGRPPYEMTGTEQKLVYKYLPRAKLGADGTLSIRIGEWNDFLWCLHQEGIGLTGAPLETDDTTP